VYAWRTYPDWGKVGKACGEGQRQCLVAHGLLP